MAKQKSGDDDEGKDSIYDHMSLEEAARGRAIMDSMPEPNYDRPEIDRREKFAWGPGDFTHIPAKKDEPKKEDDTAPKP